MKLRHPEHPWLSPDQALVSSVPLGVLRNMWLAKWGSEPVPHKEILNDIGGIGDTVIYLNAAVRSRDTEGRWTLTPHANN